MPNLSDPLGRPVRRGKYPELTWPALFVGYLLGAIICLSIGYAALILGFSIEGSELAAILGWGILRGVMRRTSIVENNINQTIASAVNGASAGMMFSIPALFILNRQSPEAYAGVTAFNPVLMVLACISGGVIGLAFVIPLRKQMIDFNRLAYPGGIAVATILKSPGAGARKAGLLLGGAVVSGTVFLLLLLTVGEDPHAPVGQWLGLPPFLNITFFISLMTIGVGFLSGRGGMVFGYGGFICYFLLAPLLAWFGSPDVQEMVVPAAGSAVDPSRIPGTLRSELFRPTGIGMLVGAAIGGIIAAFPLIVSALKSMQKAGKSRGEDGDVQSDELPVRLLYASIGFGASR